MLNSQCDEAKNQDAESVAEGKRRIVSEFETCLDGIVVQSQVGTLHEPPASVV